MNGLRLGPLRERIGRWYFDRRAEARRARDDRMVPRNHRIADDLDSGGAVDVSVADLEEGVIPGGLDLIARRIFYPYRWDREQAQLPPVIDHMVNCEGVTEADVRDMRYLSNHDVLVVRTWNWRKFYVTGIHQHEHSIKHEGNK